MATIASVNWTVSQIAFISGDISSSSMEAGDSETESIYRHCLRLTNYSNTHDEVLQISNVKRIGVAPRVGRVGLPDLAPPQALNVDCSVYYQASVAGTMGWSIAFRGAIPGNSPTWYSPATSRKHSTETVIVVSSPRGKRSGSTGTRCNIRPKTANTKLLD